MSDPPPEIVSTTDRQLWVLALNTATAALGVGVLPVSASGLVAGAGWPTSFGPGSGSRAAVELLIDPPSGRSGHSERLLPLVDWAVRMAGMTPGELEGVAVVVGPGGFTGVRTGLAVARSIAQVLGIPIWGVDTLAALAAGYGGHGLVAALLDARRGDVFAALYRIGPSGAQEGASDAGQGAGTLLDGPRLIALEAFLAELPAGLPIAFVGEGALRYQDAICRRAGSCVGPPEAHLIRPGTVARLAAPHLLAGGTDPLALLPRYQRAPTMAPDWVAGATHA